MHMAGKMYCINTSSKFWQTQVLITSQINVVYQGNISLKIRDLR